MNTFTRSPIKTASTMQATLSGIVSVRANPLGEPKLDLLHKPDKGEPGTYLNSLVTSARSQLGAKASPDASDSRRGPSEASAGKERHRR